MKLLCDVCQATAASVVCFADKGATCAACDARVHAANKLATKHHRAPLLDTSASASVNNTAPHQLCDICQERSAFFFCVEDRAVLCRHCDVSIHTANPASAKHRRYLLTGIQVDMQAAASPPSCNQISPNSNNNNGGNNTSSSAVKQRPTALAGFVAPPRPSSVNTAAAAAPSYPDSLKTVKSSAKPLNSHHSQSFPAAHNRFFADKSLQNKSTTELYNPDASEKFQQGSALATEDDKLSGKFKSKSVQGKINNIAMKPSNRNWISDDGDLNEQRLVTKPRQAAGSVYELNNQKIQSTISPLDRIKTTPKAQIYMQRLQSAGGVPFIAPTLSRISGLISAFEVNGDQKINEKKNVISVNDDTHSTLVGSVAEISPKNSDQHVNCFGSGSTADQSISNSTCCSSSNSESLQLIDIVPDLYGSDTGSNHYSKMFKMTEQLGDAFCSNLEYGEAEVPEMPFSPVPANTARKNNFDSSMNFMKDADHIELDVESWDFDYLFSDLLNPNPVSYHSQMDDFSVVPDILNTATISATNSSSNYLKKRKKSSI